MKEEPSKGVKTEIASYTPGEGFTAVKSVPGASLSGQGKELWVLRLPLHFDSEQLQGSAFCFKRKASTGKLGTLRSSTGQEFELLADHPSLAQQLCALSPGPTGTMLPESVSRHVSLLPLPTGAEDADSRGTEDERRPDVPGGGGEGPAPAAGAQEPTGEQAAAAVGEQRKKAKTKKRARAEDGAVAQPGEAVVKEEEEEGGADEPAAADRDGGDSEAADGSSREHGKDAEQEGGKKMKKPRKSEKEAAGGPGEAAEQGEKTAKKKKRKSKNKALGPDGGDGGDE